MTWFAMLTLGFLLGMRHATDADHVVAVSSIVGRTRGLVPAIRIGALWGLGHTITVLVAGGAIVLFGLVIPPRVGLSMELSVAVMLVILGGMNFIGTLRRIRETAERAHGAHTHSGKQLVRPLVVGVVHGLAGSAAVALLVVAAIPEPVGAMLYMALFGAGTMCGMMLLTSALAMPLHAVSGRFAPGDLESLMARLTGALSIAFGLFLFYQIGFVDGLFLDSPNWDPH